MIVTENINAKLFKVIFDVNDIVWDDIVEDSLDNILTKQDGSMRIVELLSAHPDAISSENVRIIIENDIENWTASLD